MVQTCLQTFSKSGTCREWVWNKVRGAMKWVSDSISEPSWYGSVLHSVSKSATRWHRLPWCSHDYQWSNLLVNKFQLLSSYLKQVIRKFQTCAQTDFQVGDTLRVGLEKPRELWNGLMVKQSRTVLIWTYSALYIQLTKQAFQTSSRTFSDLPDHLPICSEWCLKWFRYVRKLVSKSVTSINFQTSLGTFPDLQDLCRICSNQYQVQSVSVLARVDYVSGHDMNLFCTVYRDKRSSSIPVSEPFLIYNTSCRSIPTSTKYCPHSFHHDRNRFPGRRHVESGFHDVHTTSNGQNSNMLVKKFQLLSSYSNNSSGRFRQLIRNPFGQLVDTASIVGLKQARGALESNKSMELVDTASWHHVNSGFETSQGSFGID